MLFDLIFVTVLLVAAGMLCYGIVRPERFFGPAPAPTDAVPGVDRPARTYTPGRRGYPTVSERLGAA